MGDDLRLVAPEGVVAEDPLEHVSRCGSNAGGSHAPIVGRTRRSPRPEPAIRRDWPPALRWAVAELAGLRLPSPLVEVPDQDFAWSGYW
jgi:hypothetical protein